MLLPVLLRDFGRWLLFAWFPNAKLVRYYDVLSMIIDSELKIVKRLFAFNDDSFLVEVTKIEIIIIILAIEIIFNLKNYSVDGVM